MLARWTDRQPDRPAAVDVADALPADPPPLPLDPTMIESLHRVGGDALVARLIRTFAEIAPAFIDRMRAACEAGDADALSREAHSLKSSSANLGLAALSARARSLEALGREGSASAAKPEIERMKADYDDGMAELRARFGGTAAVSNDAGRSSAETASS
jgi:HPt (histidine-containing phosphotransfer) domain-containing protein